MPSSALPIRESNRLTRTRGRADFRDHALGPKPGGDRLGLLGAVHDHKTANVAVFGRRSRRSEHCIGQVRAAFLVSSASWNFGAVLLGAGAHQDERSRVALRPRPANFSGPHSSPTAPDPSAPRGAGDAGTSTREPPLDSVANGSSRRLRRPVPEEATFVTSSRLGWLVRCVEPMAS